MVVVVHVQVAGSTAMVQAWWQAGMLLEVQKNLVQ